MKIIFATRFKFPYLIIIFLFQIRMDKNLSCRLLRIKKQDIYPDRNKMAHAVKDRGKIVDLLK